MILHRPTLPTPRPPFPPPPPPLVTTPVLRPHGGWWGGAGAKPPYTSLPPLSRTEGTKICEEFRNVFLIYINANN